MAAAAPKVSEPEVSALRPDGRRVAIHPLDVRGRYMRARRILFSVLIAVYLAAPIVKIGGHPAIHLDVAQRRFFLLGGTFNAQDFWIVFFLVTTMAFALLFVTAWRGRLWCGWACPQTVFLEALYRPVERFIDGPRSRRMKLAGAPWTVGRVGRAALKHAAYLSISFIVSHAALSLFLSAAELAAMVREGPARHPAAFTWAMAVTGALYFNFAWFREQLCVVLCPYGRLQSVLHDRHSIVVAYDAGRGEPRGAKRRLPVIAGPAAARTGDCVDCRKCVHACPTAIDIRDGLQMECLACAQCADVCDEVMRKLGRAPGLIRYTSIRELDGEERRVWRPRLAVYALVALAALTGAVLALGGRRPFEAILIRPPGIPWIVEGGRIRNQLEIHLTNKSGGRARFRLTVEDAGAADVRLGDTEIELPPLGDARVPLVITLPRAAARPGLAFSLAIDDLTANVSRRETVRVTGPGL